MKGIKHIYWFWAWSIQFAVISGEFVDRYEVAFDLGFRVCIICFRILSNSTKQVVWACASSVDVFYFFIIRTHVARKSTKERLTWRGMHKTNKSKGEVPFICKEGIFKSLRMYRNWNLSSSLQWDISTSFTLKRGYLEVGCFKPPTSYFFSIKFQDNSRFRFPNPRSFIFRQTVNTPTVWNMLDKWRVVQQKLNKTRR